MANRPVYMPDFDKVGVLVKNVDFIWYPGISKQQKKKSVLSLHKAAEKLDIYPVLEVSSKSQLDVGINLSAFNLMITTKKLGSKFSVESAFQSSKVFEKGGPFVDLLKASSGESKKDLRLKESGNLVGFQFFSNSFSLEPRTFFYDWLYINALHQNVDFVDKVLVYRGFTDIEFNPKKSINCQAYSVALYLSLMKAGLLSKALSSQEKFKEILKKEYEIKDESLTIQNNLL